MRILVHFRHRNCWNLKPYVGEDPWFGPLRNESVWSTLIRKNRSFVERNTASLLRSALKTDTACSANIKVPQNRRPDFLRSQQWLCVSSFSSLLSETETVCDRKQRLLFREIFMLANIHNLKFNFVVREIAFCSLIDYFLPQSSFPLQMAADVSIDNQITKLMRSTPRVDCWNS
jgi:hypothetical protein